MHRSDPYEPSGEYLYECLECGERLWTEERTGRCSECRGELKNLAVPRE
jgi:DNA-directed RNA polymerase subunit RPC12/RpoP